MSTIIHLNLPWPPSVNRYWRHPTRGRLAGRHLISAQGRAYRETVAIQVLAQGAVKQVGRLALVADAFPPDARRRDLDNLFKSLLDALQHAGVVEDDNQFDALAIRRQHRVQGGLIRLHINSYVLAEPQGKVPGRHAQYAVERPIAAMAEQIRGTNKGRLSA